MGKPQDRSGTIISIHFPINSKRVHGSAFSRFAGSYGSEFLAMNQSRSQSLVPLDQRSENESSGSNHRSNHYERTMEITEFSLQNRRIIGASEVHVAGPAR